MNLIDIMCRQMERNERGYLEFEDGHEMTDQQLAAMNKAIGLEKTKDYRPYCIKKGCAEMPRMFLRPDGAGLECPCCGNVWKLDERVHV